ncbi:hypothetical protein MRX96_011601 [Rhipicephalus microplus]
MQCSAAAEPPDEERLLRTHGLLGLRDFCAKKGTVSLRQLDKLALAGLAREYVDSSRSRQGPVAQRTLAATLPAFAPLAVPSASGAANAGRMGQSADTVVITPEDLTKIGQYFWRVINTPRGLQQKVWFDLMIHLGSDGIENQHAMRKDSFMLLKSPADGRRRLQWKIPGGASIPDDPENPLGRTTASPRRRASGSTCSPLNNTMLALMMYDISKDAGLSRVYPNFGTQVLPEKGRFYELARCSRPSLESARKEPGCAYKLCAQCLTPVQVASAGSKGILCSVPCLEAFMRAKEARQNVRVSFRDGTRVPAYTLPTGQPLQSQPQPQPRDELGRNLPEDVYSFIQEVARIQALGHTVRTDGLPMVFKQDGSNAQARSLPIELLRIAMDVGKPTKSGERVTARPVMLSGGRKVLLVQRRDPPPPAPQRGSAAWR